MIGKPPIFLNADQQMKAVRKPKAVSVKTVTLALSQTGMASGVSPIAPSTVSLNSTPFSPKNNPVAPRIGMIGTKISAMLRTPRCNADDSSLAISSLEASLKEYSVCNSAYTLLTMPDPRMI
ncbi:hypothetical protein SDC9_117193 [bioreactor metagenome]|uniref:Uncharacterized protein n=1 Tax=bioreactor metagenome TaxID=1076179 RepID=A0A645BXM7_9ZZZZ